MTRWSGLLLARDPLRLGHDLVEVWKRLLLAALPGPADAALRVHYEHRPVGHPGIAWNVLTAYVVGADHLSLEVGHQLERQTTELLSERLVCENAVHADAVQGDAAGGELLVP